MLGKRRPCFPRPRSKKKNPDVTKGREERKMRGDNQKIKGPINLLQPGPRERGEYSGEES